MLIVCPRARTIGLTTLLALLLGPAAARADTFYVAPGGDDVAGDGSSASPWATIGHAINDAIGAEGGHTVIVRDGTYEGSVYLSRGFTSPVVVRAENPYRVTLTNTGGENEALRVYHEGPVRITFEGFIITNAHPSYTCPNGRESYYLIHLQDVEHVTLQNNIIFGNNAPGRCNELLKINRGSDTAYPRNIIVQGNIFYDPANAAGSDMIDSVRPGEIDIVDNIFVGSPSHPESQSFITLKRQVQTPPADARSPRFIVARNVFLSYNGHTDQAFVQLGEDGYAEHMITDALIENNLIIGSSPNQLAAPFQLKGSQQIMVRANTVTGDLPSSAYGFRIGTEGDNLPMAGFAIRSNIFSDPTGTMGTRLISTYGLVDNQSFVLDHNLFFNGGSPLPSGGDVTIDTDANRIEADPLLEADQSGIMLPRWDASTGSFPSGTTSIRDEHLRLVMTYGALGAGSPAIDAALPDHMPAVDIRNLLRDGSPDIGAFEVNAGGAAGSAGYGGGWGGTPATGGSAGTAAPADPGAVDEAGDCGCRLGAEAPVRSGWLGWLVLALAAARRRGR